MPRSDADFTGRGGRPKALLFDVGGVLLNAQAGVIRTVAASVGCDADAAAGAAALTAAICDGQLQDLRSLTADAFFGYWSRRWAVPAATASEVWRALDKQVALGHDFESMVTHGAEDALRRLLAGGVRLAVMSNSDGLVATRLRAAGLSHYFEFIHDSALLGLTKPDPRTYEATASRLGVPLSACWYITDMIHDVSEGALRIGLGAAVVVDPALSYPRRGDVTYCTSLHEAAELALGEPRRR